MITTNRFGWIGVFTLTLLILSTMLSTNARAETRSRWSVEEQTLVRDGAFTPIVNIYATAPILQKGNAARVDSPLGVFVFGLVNPGWAQLYGGLTFAPADWIQFSAGAGIEQADAPWQTAASIWLGHGRCSLLTVGEYGGGGGWYKAIGNAHIVSWRELRVGIGAQSQYGLGTGPRAQVQLGHATFWLAAPLVSHAEPHALSSIAGLKLGF